MDSPLLRKAPLHDGNALYIQDVSEKNGTALGARYLHNSNEKCVRKLGSLDASLWSYGPQDRLT
jgi:hypothetical protein